MYLLPARSPSLLGAYRRVSPLPVLPQQRVERPSFRTARFPISAIRRFRRPLLGQDSTPPDITQPADYTYVLSFPPAPSPSYPEAPPPNIVGVSPQTSEQITAAVASIPPPAPPSAYPPLPAQIHASYTQQPLPSNPLSYASPQAAIAAGVNPQVAQTAWTKAIASFPSAQAAIAAGIPAGVVTQLWAASRSAAAPAPAGSWLDGSTFGIKNIYLVAGVGGIALLASLGGKKGRR